MIFQEFTPQMLDFLAENHIRNSKVWYEETQGRDCRRLAIEPFYHLTEHLAPTMLEIDPQFVRDAVQSAQPRAPRQPLHQKQRLIP